MKLSFPPFSLPFTTSGPFNCNLLPLLLKRNDNVQILTFLTGHLQAVTMDGHTPKEAKVISGVPQGSVQGHLLFLVHIGDLDKRVRGSSLSSFANDTSLNLPITEIGDVPHFQ